jgi:putative ABC transport system permease protein
VKLQSLLRDLFRRSQQERDLDAELAFHLEAQVDANLRAGMTPAEARRQAHLSLGGVEQVKEGVRAVRSGVWLETLLQDVRFGARMLRKSRTFTLVAVSTLALGIGSVTTIFSVVNAVLLEPLPFPDAERLVMIWNQYGANRTDNSPPDYFDRVDQSQFLESIAAFRFDNLNLTGEGDPVQVAGGRVTASFFPTLGVAPALGRAFHAEEDAPGRDGVLVLSHRAWQRRWGGDTSAIGSKVQLNGRGFTILGVMPEGFALLFPEVEVWVPLAFPPEARANENRGNENLSVVARMKRGASLTQVRDEVAAIAARAIDTVPSRRDFLINAKWSAAVVPLREQHVEEVRPMVLTLFGAVLFVLLIACANVAGLLLARHIERGRELAIRAALGASRMRLARQLLLENLLLSSIGAIAGVLLAKWGTDFLTRLGPGYSPLLARAHPNALVLAFALGLTLVCGLFFGLVPALRTRPDAHDVLKEGAGSVSPARLVSRKALVVAEVALALVLLVGAGLLMRSFQRLWEVNPGFEAADRFSFRVALPGNRYEAGSRRIQFHQEMLARLRAHPDVIHAGTIHSLPLSGSAETATIYVEGSEQPPGSPPLGCEYRTISPGYLQAMGIPLVRGRDFSDADDEGQPRVVLVDEHAARRFWPGQDPIGRRLGFSAGRWREVVGVVGHVRNFGLDVPGQEQVYLPFQQSPQYVSFFVVHSRGSFADLVAAARAHVRSLDPGLPLFDARSMDDRLTESLAQRRLSMSLLAGFAGAALTLSAIGIYGLIAFSAGQRRREIAIRMAMGAERGRILRLVVGQGMTLTLMGLLLGALGAAALTRSIERLLFGVEPHDLIIFAAATLLLTSAALVACYVPALRASRVDPMVALRYE